MIKPILSNQMPVELQNREYGVVSRPQERFLQEIPPSLTKIGEDFRTQSTLLALPDNPIPTKQKIFEAYGEDVKFLESRHKEFADFLKDAVHDSIIVEITSLKSGSSKASELEKVWKNLEKEMPPVGKAPLMELSYIRASKEAPVLLTELKTEVSLGIERLLRVFAFWLQELVEAEFIGLVEWTADDVCRYHYFHQRASAEILNKEIVEVHAFDESKAYGERFTDSRASQTTIKRSRFLVRHVHHIVNAKLHPIRKYRGKKPARIKAFLRRIPKWLEPHLQIVDGTITMEEQIKLKVAETTSVEEEIISTYKYSPGVLLEPFNLIGWNADDLKKKRFESIDDFFNVFVVLLGITLICGIWKFWELLTFLFHWFFG